MDIRKEMPEEVKNQIINGKKRVITEKIPEHLIEDIRKKSQKKGKMLETFLSLSLRVVGGQAQQALLLEKMKNQEGVVNSAVNYAYRKMRLKNKPEYDFRFDGKENFVGMYIPPKPKKK